MKLDWTVSKRRLAYGAFTVVAFLLALRLTFPADAVKQRVLLEAAARGWQIDMASVEPGGFFGIRAEGVTIEDASGLTIPVDELTASLRLLPLLTGRRSVAFDARLYDGRAHGTADVSGDLRHLVLDVAGVDLARVLPLRKASGVDLLGKLQGTADVILPAAGGEPSGRMELSVKEAGVAGGQLPVPGMATGFALPRVGLGELVAAVRLDAGRATFERLEAKGGDADLTTDGVYVVLQPRMQFAAVAGKAKVKVQEAFWSRSGTQGFKGLAEAALATSKGRDGAWNFQVTGTVGKPSLKPVPPT
jgi:type II secretion system protein N